MYMYKCVFAQHMTQQINKKKKNAFTTPLLAFYSAIRALSNEYEKKGDIRELLFALCKIKYYS